METSRDKQLSEAAARAAAAKAVKEAILDGMAQDLPHLTREEHIEILREEMKEIKAYLDNNLDDIDMDITLVRKTSKLHQKRRQLVKMHKDKRRRRRNASKTAMIMM